MPLEDKLRQIAQLVLDCEKEPDDVCQTLLEFMINQSIEARDRRQEDIIRDAEMDVVVIPSHLSRWKH